MNRIEFMTELAALLQDVPEEERRDAMQFYNDYFDDAGVDKEEEVITELESPKKVAEKIKADLLGQRDRGEYTETGYREDGGYKRNVPAAKEEPERRNEQPYGNSGYTYSYQEKKQSNNGYTYQQQADHTAYTYGDVPNDEKKPWTSNVLKVILIIAIIFVGAPIIIPCAFAFLLVGVIGIIALFTFFFAIVICFIALAIVGVTLVFAGFIALIPEVAVGLALIGTGLIIGVIGMIGTVAGVKLCIVVIPGICRGILWVCSRPFQRKAVA